MSDRVVLPMGEILIGDVRERLAELPDESVHCVVTSPPYFGLRDYEVDGQVGLEATPEAFVAELVAVFREVRRVLRADGTLWLNIGDSYAANRSHQVRQSKHQSLDFGRSNAARVPTGLKPKDLIGIPWMLAFALRADGWFLRQENIWNKPNVMPESVRDRCTKAHESLFMLSKSKHYFFDADAIAEGLQTDPKERYEERARVLGRGAQGAAAARGGDRDKSGGFPPRVRGLPPRHQQYPGSSDQRGIDAVPRGGRRNKRSVWTVATRPFKGAHFATFPPELITPCILAGCPPLGRVLDPFMGAGTTGVVAQAQGRRFVGVELNPKYVAMAERRLLAAPVHWLSSRLHHWLAVAA